jgi:hypothetical protein
MVFYSAPDYSGPIAASVVMLLVGVVMLFVAWRGRRVDDHPLCRRCGFDLIGLPKDGKKCSECGADLGRRRAIRLGHRERRWGWVALGAFLVVEMGGWLFSHAWPEIKSYDYARHKPVWWLVRDAKGEHAARRDRAVELLVGWLKNRELTNEQRSEVVDLLLAVQKDPGRTWNPRWGLMLEELQDTARLTPQQFETYLRQAAGFQLITRQNVRRGDPLPIAVHPVNWNFAGRGWEAAVKIEELKVDGVLLPAANIKEISTRVWVRDAPDAIVSLEPVLPQLREGSRRLDCVASLKFERLTPLGGKTYEPVRLALSANFMLHPADVQTVTLVNAVEMRKQVSDCFVVAPVRVQKSTLVRITCERPPIGFCFAVIARQGANGAAHRVAHLPPRLLGKPGLSFDTGWRS